MVLVSGEAGLGKTTVISEACRLAFDGGACVLFGHCEEDLAAPYQLFSEALGHFVRSAPPQLLVDHAGSWGSALARLAPVLSSRLPGVQPSTSTDPGTERYQVFAAVVGLLVMVSRSKPVVLVLDDLQWADRASLQLLRHVVGVDQPMRLLVLGSYRDTELSHAHPLMATLADLHRHGGVTRLEVTGLNERGVALLLEAAGGHTLDDTTMRLAKALHRETDGNPFFVSELLRHLSNSGAIHHDVATGRWTAAATLDPTGLPASVRTVIGGRVGRLGGDAGRVLSLAAVIGQDFDLDLLARASTTGEDDILDILDTAIAAALVRELTDTPGHYSFAHALIQHTLYQDLGRTRRARAHRQVAEALEGLCGDRPGSRVGELARHWFSASHADAEVKALDYSRRAADAALAALAPGDALHYYTQALGLYARSDDRDPILGIDLAIGLGTAQRQSGDVAFRNTLLDAARRAAAHDDTDRLVAAALANNRGMLSTSGNVDTERVEMLELALDRLPADHPSRPLVLAKLCSEITYGSSLERRQALADEAVALAHFTGDDATIARVLNDIYWPMSMPHLLQQSLAWAVDALERAERLGDPVQLFWAADQRASLALRSGDIEEMDRCLGISWSLAERLNQPTLNWMRAYTHAMRAQLAGDTDEAETWATGALRIGTHGGEPDASAFCALQLGSLRRQRGTDGERIPLIAKLAAELPAETEALTASLARIYAEVGRLDDAHQLLEQFAAADFEQRPNPGTSLVTLIDYASAAIACRDTAIADALYDRLEPFADQVPINGVIVHDHISYFLGGLVAVLGCYDKGDAYYAHAAAFNERAGAKFFAARTNLAWARMLIERDAPGDTERARNLLAVAHASATTHRYPRVQRQTAEALGHADQVDLCRRHPHLEKKHGNTPAVRSRSSPVVVSSTCS
jgi:tetratricopeptide (TPR) repeat protein